MTVAHSSFYFVSTKKNERKTTNNFQFMTRINLKDEYVCAPRGVLAYPKRTHSACYPPRNEDLGGEGG